MKTNLLKKITVCMLACAFLACGINAGTNVIKNSNDKKEQKKDKISIVSWTGTILVDTDLAGAMVVSFTNDKDMQPYSVLVDVASKKILADIKTNSKVKVKGTYIEKADGTAFLKLTDCKIVEEKEKEKEKKK
ncbi:MAG TPA: hypothetical protein DET40_00575 [Lentisphaeria bacterium]|nr:MAG: hypothetical protein A2X45_05200 [Lentisphaerae bacterium GWF2_50_93]HCE42027.1 hypothetical protein [Lentisphaeria bacterium]